MIRIVIAEAPLYRARFIDLISNNVYNETPVLMIIVRF